MSIKGEDLWCLVCSGSVFGEGVNLQGNDSEKLRNQFHKVLKAPVPKKPPSDNICKRCDRNIRRLADTNGEAAEREIEYMRKTYRKTVQDYNAKAEIRKQKLRKAAEAFMLIKPKEPKEVEPEKKLSVFASKWKFKAKSGAATTKIPLPVSSGNSSPSRSKPQSGETTPSGELYESKKSMLFKTASGEDNGDPDLAEDNAPSESKAALIENEGGVDNVESTSITVNIGGKTDDGAGVKGENVKLNVKDGGVKSSTEGGDDNTVNDDVSSTTTDGSSISNVVISTTGDGGDASKDDKKSDEKDDKNKTEDKKDEKKDDKKAEKKDGKKAEKKDGKTDDKNANTDGGKSEDEKVKSVKDAVKEIEGEDGGSEKSTVNGTVMKSDKKSVKGGSDQAKDQSKEKSPLIEKESNVKDTGPGVLCCSIL